MTDFLKKEIKEKKRYIFIIQTDEDQLYAGRQIDVDNAIKEFENAEQEIDFKVIGRIFEPQQGLPKDFDEKNIEWYDSNAEHSPAFLKRAVNAIINLIF